MENKLTMEAWANKYPFCADMMCGNFTEEELTKRLESGFYD